MQWSSQGEGFYPDFEQCLTMCTTLYQPGFKRVGGIDFGFRNPFAAVWRLRTNLVVQALFLL
jgi:hypothetical protein